MKSDVIGWTAGLDCRPGKIRHIAGSGCMVSVQGQAKRSAGCSVRLQGWSAGSGRLQDQACCIVKQDASSVTSHGQAARSSSQHGQVSLRSRLHAHAAG